MTDRAITNLIIELNSWHKETKKIKVTPKIGKISDLDSDGLNSGEKNPKADCKIVYTVYSIK
jgi:hypothetical protein